jgi:hypothetical protein
VPLSENEQRLLEQMERALYAEDPKFASSLRGADARRHYRRRLLLGFAGLFLGLILLAVGVLVGVWVGLVGCLVMFLSGIFSLSSRRHMVGATLSGTPVATRGRSRKPRRSFMTTLEERWARRNDEGQT